MSRHADPVHGSEGEPLAFDDENDAAGAWLRSNDRRARAVAASKAAAEKRRRRPAQPNAPGGSA